MERGFFLVCVGFRGKYFIEKGADMSVDVMYGVSIVLKEFSEEF